MRTRSSRPATARARIFDWLAAGGGVFAFVTRYAPERERSWLSVHGPSARLDYFDYDWALNTLPNKVE